MYFLEFRVAELANQVELSTLESTCLEVEIEKKQILEQILGGSMMSGYELEARESTGITRPFWDHEAILLHSGRMWPGFRAIGECAHGTEWHARIF